MNSWFNGEIMRLQPLSRAALAAASPARPPGLNPPTKRGKGKGKGKDTSTQVEEDFFEAAKQLCEAADPVQQSLLEKVGLAKPKEPPAELADLCKRYLESMPEEIQKAVLESDPKPTPQQQLNQASKNFKAGAQRLRVLIMEKATLQTKLDRQKHEYHESLEAMQKLVQEEEKQQEKVARLQKELLSTVPKPVLTPLSDDLTEALKKAGVSEEQLEATRAHLAQTKSALPSQETPFQFGPTPPPLGKGLEGKPGQSAADPPPKTWQSREAARAGVLAQAFPITSLRQDQAGTHHRLGEGTAIPGIGRLKTDIA
eukprot:s4657_g7.t1